MSIDVDQYWSQVPHADDDENAGATIVRKARPSRRTMFKSIGVLGGALALNIVSALPPSRANRAEAAVGNEYTNCAGYDNFSGYNDNSKICVGAPYSKSHCGGDGWFLRGSGTCWNSYATKACGNGMTKRNAWRWKFGSTPYRCADGYVATCDGSTVLRICSWPNP
ncbi:MULTISPECIES: hypothetical protein [Nonomuraea]|uniref:Twin-arginine translocation signal domain-containing protein n=1 Tax=Nonomuraea mangrovi TaxID=2316207 RepID=A0ABW4TEZ8_9ACTN